MHVHLAEHGRRYSAAIGFVGEQGHALLNAERLEDCLGDAEGKAVEWPDKNDAVEALICGVQALAYGRSDFTKDLRRDALRAPLKHRSNIVGLGDQKAGPQEYLAELLLRPGSGLRFSVFHQLSFVLRDYTPRGSF